MARYPRTRNTGGGVLSRQELARYVSCDMRGCDGTSQGLGWGEQRNGIIGAEWQSQTGYLACHRTHAKKGTEGTGATYQPGSYRGAHGTSCGSVQHGAARRLERVPGWGGKQNGIWRSGDLGGAAGSKRMDGMQESFLRGLSSRRRGLAARGKIIKGSQK